jgi:hypothetical protein
LILGNKNSPTRGANAGQVDEDWNLAQALGFGEKQVRREGNDGAQEQFCDSLLKQDNP